MATVEEQMTGPHAGSGDAHTRTQESFQEAPHEHTEQETPAGHGGDPDPDGAWVYRVGGLAALILGLAYIVTIPLYAHVGAPPSTGAAWLTYGAGKTTEWWAILGLSVLADVLFVPVAVALYRVLHRVNRTAMLLATSCVGLFVVLDLAVTWPNYAALHRLSPALIGAPSSARAA